MRCVAASVKVDDAEIARRLHCHEEHEDGDSQRVLGEVEALVLRRRRRGRRRERNLRRRCSSIALLWRLLIHAHGSDGAPGGAHHGWLAERSSRRREAASELEEAEEADAQSTYEKVTQENKITKTAKEQDVKYKTQESKSLDKTASEYSSDREGANTELTAVLDYYAKIKDRCIAKPETYEERQRRRSAEIAGLKEALAVLKEETAFVQRKRHGSFRGSPLSADTQ